ncbi:MAG: YibE/F family protein [Oscillospiraceae bacterium]
MASRLFGDKKANIRRAIILVLTAGFLVFLYFFNQVEIVPLTNREGVSYEKARVVRVLQDNLQQDGTRAGSQTVEVELLSGDMKGEVVQAQSLSGYLYGADCTPGLEVTLYLSRSGENIQASVYNYYRSPILYLLIGLFLLTLWLIGGRRGIKSAIGLVFTFACIIFLYLPMLYRGFSPFFAAVIVVALTTAVTMYLIGGATKKTVSSILGTIAGVVVSGVVATVFGSLGNISGFNVSEIETLISIERVSGMQVGGLLFSGILIASLGAVMDVAMSVASTIQEIYDQNPSLDRWSLFKSGINVGRDMMGTMSNTLILAFAGSSISTLVITYAYAMPYNQVMNMYSIGIEILQGISGTMGVILTVPIVSFLAPLLLTRKKEQKLLSADHG